MLGRYSATQIKEGEDQGPRQRLLAGNSADDPPDTPVVG